MNSKLHIFYHFHVYQLPKIGPPLRASSDKFVFIFSIKNRLQRQQQQRFSFIMSPRPPNTVPRYWAAIPDNAQININCDVHHRANDVSETVTPFLHLISSLFSLLWTWKEIFLDMPWIIQVSFYISWAPPFQADQNRTSILFCLASLIPIGKIMAHS